MLEFLSNCREFNIAKRAKDCERNLTSFNSISPMAVLSEAVLKSMYKVRYDVDDEDVKSFTFYVLLKNEGFIKNIKDTYNLQDSTVDSLNRNVRKIGNDQKHGTSPSEVSEELKRDAFKSVFDLCVAYYCVEYSPDCVPKWDEAAYRQLADKEYVEKKHRQREAELNQTINEQNEVIKDNKRTIADLNVKLGEFEFKINEILSRSTDNSEILELRDQVGGLEKSVTEKQNEKVRLNARLNEEIRRSNELEEKLNAIASDDKIKSDEQEILIRDLRKKRDDAEESRKQLESENAELIKLIDSLQEKANSLKVLLEESSKTLFASDELEKLQAELKKVKAEKETAEENLANATAELRKAQAEQGYNGSETERFNREIVCWQKEKAELESDAPYCDNCGSKMVLRFGKESGTPFWGCPNYPKCETIKWFTGPQKKKYNAYKEKIDKLNEQYKSGKNEREKVHFDPYPDVRKLPDTYLYRTISVPKEVFDVREENKVDWFSKFRVSFIKMQREPVREDVRTIYSLALRILNRGEVLPMYDKTDNELRNTFNKNEYGTINNLFDAIEYSHPILHCGSQTEADFARYYFPQVLGKNWATYVSTQMAVNDLLTNTEDKKQFDNRRVGFLINKNGRKIVVEIDGNEQSRQQTEYDKKRDAALRDNEYDVLRFTASEVKSKSNNVLERLFTAVGANNSRPFATGVDTRFLVASKLSHQFAVAIVAALEKGFISNEENLYVFADTKLFNELELQYILSVAVSEVLSLLYHLADIYGVDMKWNMFSETSDKTTICAGDGVEAGNGGIIIRDCVLPINYNCSIEAFTDKTLPVNVTKNSVRFFLKYIFGFNEFREGQYAAIERILMRQDSVILLPTGSGKSIIYQLTSYLVPGMTVVIDPLVSLMEDQIENLKKNNGITNAIFFRAADTEEARQQNMINRVLMQSTSISLIYIAPERLQIPSFRSSVSGMLNRNTVFTVAIDEAHCVSEWGHDFRPAYLNVRTAARKLFGNPVITALTGTASDKVLNDVQNVLKIKGEESLIQPESFDRAELHYSIKKCSVSEKVSTIAEIVTNSVPEKLGIEYDELTGKGEIKHHSGIIFTPFAVKKNSIYAAEKLSEDVKKRLSDIKVGKYFSAEPEGYTEETWKYAKEAAARSFKNDDTDILVATNAFGMGIDKPNIHYIVHNGIPASFEEYYQEAGRAGRDRNHSECIIVFSDEYPEVYSELLNPGLSYIDFQNKYSEYLKHKFDKRCEDDLSANLYFHKESFKGVTTESRMAVSLIKMFVKYGFNCGKQMTFTATKDQQNDIIKALVRLITLGIITDYTYNYSETYDIILGSIERDSLIKHYGNYVIAERRKAEVERLEKSSKEGLEFCYEVVEALISYIYDYIEKSRRRAIADMYNLAKTASLKDEEAQNRFIRRRIESYFQYTGDNRRDLKLIENGSNAGLDVLPKVAHLEPEVLDYTDEEKERAAETYVLSGRLLEAKPDHPGLLFMNTVGRLLSGEYEVSTIKNTIAAAVKFARSRYSVDDEKIKPVVFSVLNLTMDKSEELFDEVLMSISEEFQETENEILEQLIKSDCISDDNRNYLLALYAENMLLERKKENRNEQ